MWVPAHKGVVPNVYADMIAKTFRRSAAPVETLRKLARKVCSRAVLYARNLTGVPEVINQAICRGARLDALRWIRRRAPWGPRAQPMQPLAGWNETVLEKAGNAPRAAAEAEDEEAGETERRRAPSAEELATQRSFLRLAVGMRQQQIVGGPRHTRTMLHAATTGGFARFALDSGCRACDTIAAPPETLRHVFLECGAVPNLLGFRRDVYKCVRLLLNRYRRVGVEAVHAVSFLERALAAVYNYQSSPEQWAALMALVGACIPECEAPPERLRRIKAQSDRAVVQQIRALQGMFLGRLQDWSRATVRRTQRQQSKWNQREWLRLVLRAWRTARGAAAAPSCDADRRWRLVESNRTCCVGACLAYVRLVLRPLLRERDKERCEVQRKQTLRRRLRYYLRKYVGVCTKNRVLNERSRVRSDHVVSRTRGATVAVRINYAERGAARRQYIGRTALYKTHRWPRRDRIGLWAHAAFATLTQGGLWTPPP